MDFKQKVYREFHELLKKKVQLLENVLIELKESGSNETKSTAGDKHETALAMLQIEQENKRKQLKDAAQLLTRFEKINPADKTGHVIKGSLVKTNKGYLLVCVAAGKITMDGITVIALSPESPLGAKLMGSKEHTTIEMNNILYYIENID